MCDVFTEFPDQVIKALLETNLAGIFWPEIISHNAIVDVLIVLISNSHWS